MRAGTIVRAAAAAVLGAGLVVSLGASAGMAGYQGANGKIAFSSAPDGSPWSAYEIWTMGPNGENRTRLTNNSVPDFSPSFGPNGTLIAFVRETANTAGDIWTMSASGGSTERLTSNPAYDDSPAIGPGSAKIAFTRSVGDANGDIWIMNVDGSGLTQLTETNTKESDPVFSPDGSRIAFTCGVGGVLQICSMNVNGSDRVQLTDCQKRDCVAPDYSPSGGKIAYSGYCLKGEECWESAEIWTISPNGANETRLTAVGGWAEYPHFSPDASKIGFTDGGTGGPEEIAVLRISDGSVTNLTNTPQADEWASDWQST